MPIGSLLRAMSALGAVFMLAVFAPIFHVGGGAALAAASAGRESDQAPGKQPAAKADASRCVARIGKEYITLDEFSRDMAFRASQIKKARGETVEPDRVFRARVLQEIIDARVLRILAANECPVTDAQIDVEIDRGKKVLGGDEQYQKFLKSQGFDETKLRDEVRSKIAVAQYRQQRTGHVQVSEEEIAAQFQKMQQVGKGKRDEKTIDFQQIIIALPSVDPAVKEAAKNALVRARERILGGEDMETVVKEVSQDPGNREHGGWRWEIPVALLTESLTTVLKDMKMGDVSQPLEIENAMVLVKVAACHEPGDITIDEAHERLRRGILDRKQREELATLIDQAKVLMDIEILQEGLKPVKKSAAPGNEKAPESAPQNNDALSGST